MLMTSAPTLPVGWADSLTFGQLETGNRLDRLMTVEIRPPRGGLPTGIVVPMYEICRKHHGGPLSMAAASALNTVVRPHATVLIATGAGVPPNLPVGETDGPVGAAALAIALTKAFAVKVVLVTEDAHLPPVAAVARIANRELATWHSGTRQPTPPAVTVESFPLGLASGESRARTLMEQFSPVAIVFVERDGPNVEGQFHGVRGDCRNPEKVGYVYLLAYEAARAGVLTVGIGDGGNEVGFGAVRERIRDVLPMQGRSLAGHPSGVVTVASTDVTVSASVSNWGACAVAAALGVLRGDLDIVHQPVVERDLIAAAVSAGARDGATSRQQMAVDGIDIHGHVGLVTLVRAIAEVAIGDSSPS